MRLGAFICDRLDCLGLIPVLNIECMRETTSFTPEIIIIHLKEITVRVYKIEHRNIFITILF